MSAVLEEWKPKLADLPQEDRAELAYFLLTTLNGKPNRGVDPWNAEIQGRLDEVLAGTAVGVSLDQVKAEFRRSDA